MQVVRDCFLKKEDTNLRGEGYSVLVDAAFECPQVRMRVLDTFIARQTERPAVRERMWSSRFGLIVFDCDAQLQKVEQLVRGTLQVRAQTATA